MLHFNRSFVILVLAALLAACAGPAAAPTATPVPPTATPGPPTTTPTPVPPTATPAPPPPAAAGKIETIEGQITSQALAGNLLGDPTARRFSILLPPSYANGDKNYPVVYILPWGDGDPRTHVNEFKAYMELLLKKGEIKEMIVVVADGTNSLGASQFRSSTTIGDYETYLTEELVDYVDSHYRTIPSRDSRGLAGCSNGGDATVRLALKYPDVFAVAAASGGLYDEMLEQNTALTKELKLLKQLPENSNEVVRLSTTVKWYIQAAAGTVSNPDNPPLYLDMPFRIVDGQAEIVPEVSARIAEYDSAHEAQRYVQQPLRLRGLLIQHALYDIYNPTEIVHGFDRLLTELGVEHEYVEESTTHCSNPWETASLKFMADKLVFEEK